MSSGVGVLEGSDMSQSLSSLTCLPPPAPRGKRGWKSFHGVLKGMILYLQKVWGAQGWEDCADLGVGRWAGTEAGRSGHPHRKSTSLGKPWQRPS